MKKKNENNEEANVKNIERPNKQNKMNGCENAYIYFTKDERNREIVICATC